MINGMPFVPFVTLVSDAQILYTCTPILVLARLGSWLSLDIAPAF